MPRTVTIEKTLYKFDELSEKAQQKALERLYDINVSYDWWDSTYDDAKAIGLKITSFDLDRDRHAKGELIESYETVIDNIIKEHGETCETYKTALGYQTNIKDIKAKYEAKKLADPALDEDDLEYDMDQELEELESDFEKALLEDYAIILQKEYEYLTSEDAIKETIEANEYEFNEKGEIDHA